MYTDLESMGCRNRPVTKEEAQVCVAEEQRKLEEERNYGCKLIANRQHPVSGPQLEENASNNLLFKTKCRPPGVGAVVPGM